jgi:hypothetical protein
MKRCFTDTTGSLRDWCRSGVPFIATFILGFTTAYRDDKRPSCEQQDDCVQFSYLTMISWEFERLDQTSYRYLISGTYLDPFECPLRES